MRSRFKTDTYSRRRWAIPDGVCTCSYIFTVSGVNNSVFKLEKIKSCFPLSVRFGPAKDNVLVANTEPFPSVKSIRSCASELSGTNCASFYIQIHHELIGIIGCPRLRIDRGNPSCEAGPIIRHLERIKRHVMPRIAGITRTAANTFEPDKARSAFHLQDERVISGFLRHRIGIAERMGRAPGVSCCTSDGKAAPVYCREFDSSSVLQGRLRNRSAPGIGEQKAGYHCIVAKIVGSQTVKVNQLYSSPLGISTLIWSSKKGVPNA